MAKIKFDEIYIKSSRIKKSNKRHKDNKYNESIDRQEQRRQKLNFRKYLDEIQEELELCDELEEE